MKRSVQLFASCLRYRISSLLEQSLKAHASEHFLKIGIFVSGFCHIATTLHNFAHEIANQLARLRMRHQHSETVPNGVMVAFELGLIKPVGHGTGLSKAIRLVRAIHFTNGDLILAGVSHRFHCVPPRNGKFENEYRFPFKLINLLAVHHQGHLMLVGIDTHFRFLFRAVNITSSADMDERLFLVPGRLVEIKSIFFYLPVKRDKPFLIEPMRPAFVPAIRGKIEHIP